MKKSRYTEEQIIGILKQHEAGIKTADVCREHGISAATFYGSAWWMRTRASVLRLRLTPASAVDVSRGCWSG